MQAQRVELGPDARRLVVLRPVSYGGDPTPMVRSLEALKVIGFCKVATTQQGPHETPSVKSQAMATAGPLMQRPASLRACSCAWASAP